MRIIIAPDSFKGSLTAKEAAHAMSMAAQAVFPSAVIEQIPMADGGEGTVEALVTATQGRIYTETVQDPLGRPIQAQWGMLGNANTAIIAMAEASALTLLTPAERNPLLTTTYGTGQLIAKALEHLHSTAVPQGSARPQLIIGIGGSATNDAGVGALQALGIQFLTAQGEAIAAGGQHLAAIVSINTQRKHPLLDKTDIIVACDVQNPLCGPQGASAIFGPQKGATSPMVATLDAALAHFAAKAQAHTGRNVASLAGAGAAGGLGAGLLFFTNATLRPGIALVQELTNFSTRIEHADFIITGEGQTDEQTAMGKVPAGIAALAQQYGTPVLCISGALQGNITALHGTGITALFSAIQNPACLEDCLTEAAVNLTRTTEQVCRTLALGMTLTAPANN